MAPRLPIAWEALQGGQMWKGFRIAAARAVVVNAMSFTVYENTKKILDAGASPVVGTSGLTSDEFIQLKQYCDEMQLGGIIVPNFSIGAVLMMRYAQDAAKYLPNVEIIEMHHPNKVDAPSGTAKATAALITGSEAGQVPIHSVRLPGMFRQWLVSCATTAGAASRP